MFEVVFWQIFAGRADMDIHLLPSLARSLALSLRCQNAMYATRVIASSALLLPCESVGRLRTISSAVCTDMSR